MSDREVRAAIEKMEAWVADPSWEPSAIGLELWNAEFQLAMSRAEKGKGWAVLMDRAHSVGQELSVRTSQLELLRDDLKAELNKQQHGIRALKGYGAGTR